MIKINLDNIQCFPISESNLYNSLYISVTLFCPLLNAQKKENWIELNSTLKQNRPYFYAVCYFDFCKVTFCSLPTKHTWGMNAM